MIVTEEEAQTMWCPMVRCSCHMAGESFNRVVRVSSIEDGSYNKCISSRCMMWVRIDGKGKGKCGLVTQHT